MLHLRKLILLSSIFLSILIPVDAKQVSAIGHPLASKPPGHLVFPSGHIVGQTAGHIFGPPNVEATKSYGRNDEKKLNEIYRLAVHHIHPS